MLRNFFCRDQLVRVIGGLGLTLATVAMAAPSGLAADTGVLHLRCTNAANGASWVVTVDLDKSLVDSRPATISDGAIKWRDPGGGTFEFDRATGKLQLRVASSTGGNFLHYTCKPE